MPYEEMPSLRMEKKESTLRLEKSSGRDFRAQECLDSNLYSENNLPESEECESPYLLDFSSKPVGIQSVLSK